VGTGNSEIPRFGYNGFSRELSSQGNPGHKHERF